MTDVLTALRAEIPDLQLLTDEIDRESYRRDEALHLRPGLPLAIALPRSADEVASIVRIAAAHRVPLVPRGAGSGLSGGSAGIEGALTIVLTRMNEILEIDVVNRVAVVQPGVINADLKTAVLREGLFYAPDPASYEFCTIGGNIGTNAGGLCCVKYGVTREAVAALEVVLADGSIIRTGGRTVKDVAGYALTQLMVGSQGTLGIITEATLRLRAAPPLSKTMLAFFPTLESAADAVTRIMIAGLTPCTLELMDRYTIAAVDDWHRLGLDRTSEALLLIESDLGGESAEAEITAAEAACQAAGASEVVRATERAEADWLRQVRRLAYRALERMGACRMEDVVVPRSRLLELLAEIRRIGERHKVESGTFGHVGDGNLHPTFVWDRGDAAAEARVEAACEDLYRAAMGFGGSLTGEHGIGAARVHLLSEQRGPDAVRVMQRIKTALDPLHILNPGRAVPLD